MEENKCKYHCEVISPAGKLLDCPAFSVVIPAHDGLRGILCNHIPMFCALGLGIMAVRRERPEVKEIQKPVYYFIDGGFALFAANLLKIIAYDAVCLEGLTGEQIDHIRQRFQRRLTHKGISEVELAKETERLRFLDKLIELNNAVAAAK